MTGYEALRTRAAWIDVSGRGKIRVTGEDRARLLHAMSTNDVKSLAPEAGLYAFFLNDKGRILADAYLYNLGDSLLLDTEPELAGKLRDHLDRYIIADDAELSEETDRWGAIDLAGPGAVACAEELGLPVPEAQYGVRKWANGWAARVASTGEGLRVFVALAKKDQFVAQLQAAQIPNAGADEARIVRLENGMPRYGEDIAERYLVQETNAMHAVHTNKGCYLGQEIVERVRSRGQVHRVLMPIRVEGTEAPAPGTKLMAGDKAVAEISSAVYSPALGEVAGLAYVRSEAAEAKPELVVAGSEPPQRGRIL
ncbi:MAG TPA: glycine cleavage T C-terminal barrel domain-containing protein [Bryobacteraceae bacterium]|jgi:aminomethyltransferase|nr:glycine cleavage T C-terminal barrel domain-containing protein [Bryobacteraceae bacterium]